MDLDPPQTGEVYRHHKGGLYVVVCIAMHTEIKDEPMVVYRSSRHGTIHARPLFSWLSPTSDGQTRFQRVR